MRIDINSDLGEGFGPYKMGDDEHLLEVITSANIACGFHAGDPLIMANTIRMACARGVDIGAHPGFADREYFGRRPLTFDGPRLEAEVLYQIGALDAIAQREGAAVTHFSFHGALGNMVLKDRALAERLVGAIANYNPRMTMPVMQYSEGARAAEKFGLRTVNKFFADRGYDKDGRLVDRKEPGAVIYDHQAVAQRVIDLLETGKISTMNGTKIAIDANVVVIHSDTPGAFELARLIRNMAEGAGGEIVPLSQIVQA